MTDLSDALVGEGVSKWLADSVANLARGGPESISGLLVAVGGTEVLGATRTTVRTHFVERDGNRTPRIDALAARLAHKAVDYCIPRSRISEAEKEYLRTGSTAGFTRLAIETRELFTRITNSGEGGELLLYLLLEEVLRLPQILCKMPLKTNAQMHVHGIDGVHAKILDNDVLALYWGEAKMHANVSSAVDSCFESISPFLTEGPTGTSKRDLLLLRDNLDADTEELTSALVRYFGEGSEAAQVEVRAGCLIGFDIENYPEPFTDDGEAISSAVQAAIDHLYVKIAGRISHHSISAFEIEVFCVPFPSVDSFRTAVRKQLAAL